MEGYKTFTQALDHASFKTSLWKDADDQSIIYSWADLMNVAAIIDTEYSLNENIYYLVFDDGEIDILNTDTKEIDQMFLPSNNTGIKQKERDSFSIDPSIIRQGTISEINREKELDKIDQCIMDKINELFDDDKNDTVYCRYCGEMIPNDSVYCPKCGRKVGK